MSAPQPTKTTSPTEAENAALRRRVAELEAAGTQAASNLDRDALKLVQAAGGAHVLSLDQARQVVRRRRELEAATTKAANK